jgi:hypothetical protein
MPRDRAEADALMSKSIEDILVCIHDEPGQDEHAKLGRMVREVSAHLVPFGHYTSTERVRIARALRDKNLGTQLSDGIADMIHNTSRRRRA